MHTNIHLHLDIFHCLNILHFHLQKYQNILVVMDKLDNLGQQLNNLDLPIFILVSMRIERYTVDLSTAGES